MHIATIRLASSVLFMPTNVTVLLPETPPPAGGKYKVLWLLHWAGADDRTYLYKVDFEDILKKHSVMVVMPSAINSDFGHYPAFGRGYDFPKFFFEELMPFIWDNFAASDRPEDNYMEGASMGAFGAMSLGLARPERFAALGMLGASLRESAFLESYRELGLEQFRRDALAEPKRFPTEYGDPDCGIKPKEVNIITKYPTVQAFYDSPDCMWYRFQEAAAAGRLPRIYVACGTEDLFYEANRRFRDLAEQLGVQDKVHFNLPEGVDHDEAFFCAEIGRFLDYYQV